MRIVAIAQETEQVHGDCDPVGKLRSGLANLASQIKVAPKNKAISDASSREKAI